MPENLLLSLQVTCSDISQFLDDGLFFVLLFFFFVESRDSNFFIHLSSFISDTPVFVCKSFHCKFCVPLHSTVSIAPLTFSECKLFQSRDFGD